MQNKNNNKQINKSDMVRLQRSKRSQSAKTKNQGPKKRIAVSLKLQILNNNLSA